MNKGIDQEAANRKAATLTAILMYALNIPLENLVTYKHWSGKNYPRLLLNKWANGQVLKMKLKIIKLWLYFVS